MVRYSEELIEEIKSSNDIVDIISQYVVLKRSGRNFFGLCPFHKEKSPSFSVSPDRQIFHCFGCGVGGNVIHFISKIENLNFKESLEMLAERSNITLPTADYQVDTKRQKLKEKIYEINEKTANFYHQNLYNPLSKEAQEYVKQRKLDNKTLKAFHIGYADNSNRLYKFLKDEGYTDEEILKSDLVSNHNGKFTDKFRHRLMFPIQDVRDRFIAFGGRVLDKSLPKYINSPENLVFSKGRNLFGMNIAKRARTEKIIIVEGYMDAISLHQRGITNVVASCGTALTEAQGRLLRKYAQKVIISYDSDSAGQSATLRGLEILDNLGCDVRILQMDGAKDPDEYVIKYGNGRFNSLVDQAISLVEFKIKMLKSKLDIENTKDRIQFLNEIANLLGTIDNRIEQEVYIDKISKEYKISKEAIYAQINKFDYNKSSGDKILVKAKVPLSNIKKDQLTPEIIKREKIVIYLLINGDKKTYNKIMQEINIDDIQKEEHKGIIEKICHVFEKNLKIDNLLNLFTDDKEINIVTEIMADDYEIKDNEKALEDIINIYKKEKLTKRKNEIINLINSATERTEEIIELEKELIRLSQKK